MKTVEGAGGGNTIRSLPHRVFSTSPTLRRRAGPRHYGPRRVGATRGPRYYMPSLPGGTRSEESAICMKTVWGDGVEVHRWCLESD